MSAPEPMSGRSYEWPPGAIPTLARRTPRAGAEYERASGHSSSRCPPVISKAPAVATSPLTLQQITF